VGRTCGWKSIDFRRGKQTIGTANAHLDEVFAFEQDDVSVGQSVVIWIWGR
jgi:hypothetical protein